MESTLIQCNTIASNLDIPSVFAFSPRLIPALHQQFFQLYALARMKKNKLFDGEEQGCAIIFNRGPNSIKHNILRAAPFK